LKDPVDEEAKQSSSYVMSVGLKKCRRRREHTGDTGILRQMVREVLEARPDGFNAALQEITRLDAKNGSPHSSNES